MTETILVHPDAETLAAASAARLITTLIDLQSIRRPLHLALTGGSIGIALLEQVKVAPARGAVDWSEIHFWWGDERFLPKGDPERNETQARDALLNSLAEVVPPSHIHPIPASDQVDNPAIAAAQYQRDLPHFDLVLLGVGPDGHVASIFPSHPEMDVETLGVVPVEDSPKPPPQRVSLTLPTINDADQVWLIAAGRAKAPAVAAGVGNDLSVPAGRIQASPEKGMLPDQLETSPRRVLWLIDVAAGELLPPAPRG